MIMIVKMKNALSELNSAKVSSAEFAESFPKLLTSDEISPLPQMNNSTNVPQFHIGKFTDRSLINRTFTELLIIFKKNQHKAFISF